MIELSWCFLVKKHQCPLVIIILNCPLFKCLDQLSGSYYHGTLVEQLSYFWPLEYMVTLNI